MFRDYFINIAILISFIFISAEIFKHHAKTLHSYKRVMFLGGVNGLLGIVFMWYDISINPSMNVDLSYLPIIFAAFYGGLSSSIFSLFIIGLAGWTINTFPAIEVSSLLVFALVCFAIVKLQQPWWLKWAYALMCNCIIMYVTLIIKGDLDVYVKTLYQSLLTLVTASIAYSCVEYVKHSTNLYVQFKEQSTRDFLTGLTNTRYFQTMLQKYIGKVGQYYQKLSIIMIDIDFFKSINDKYGHRAGDVVLEQLSVIITHACSPFDVVSRVGGEEFAVLAYDYPHSVMLKIAENLRLAIQNHKFVLPSGRSIHITASIGVATYPDTVKDISIIFELADNALYEAKNSGRNTTCSA